jgi:hypothetical protein
MLSGLALDAAFEARAADERGTAFVKAVDEATEAAGTPSFEAKTAQLLTFFHHTDDGYYVVDGDYRRTDEQIRELIKDRHKALKGEAPWPREAIQGELVINLESGVPTCHRTPEARRLTYTIDKASFDTAPEANAYETVKAALEQAGRAWANACPECGISYTFVEKQDPAPGDAYFIVKYAGPQAYVASAFFPNDPPAARTLVIASEYFTSDFDRVGVLRHELGHTLGYRHEHIRPEMAFLCYNPNDPRTVEPSNWRPLGDYDAHSVMHYPCGNGGSRKLELTEQDLAQHRNTYLKVCK